MKHILLAAAAVFTLASAPVLAQTATSETTSNANNTANQVSASGAIAAGNIIQFPEQPATTTVRQEGTATTRIESAPSLGGLAVGGGHPCAWTPGSAQISIIGGGLGGAQMQVDEACMLAVMAAASGSGQMQQAALMIIAGRDADACKAMYQTGLVADCVDKRGRSTVRAAAPTTVSTRSSVTPTAPKLWTKCQLEGNQIKIRYTSEGRKDKTGTAIKCQKALGY